MTRLTLTSDHKASKRLADELIKYDSVSDWADAHGFQVFKTPVVITIRSVSVAAYQKLIARIEEILQGR